MGKKSLDGKTALITGSAVRIGREIALSLAERGVNIIIHYHSSKRHTDELSSELDRMGVRSWSIQADLSRFESDKLIEQSLELSGSLGILVNNASIFTKSTIDDLTLADLVNNIEINAWAPFSLSRAYAREIKRGCIINLLDQRITSYDLNHTGYILSKHVLTALTRITALAYAPEIRVNGIAPGLILPPPGEPMSYLEKLSGTIPLKRHGNPGNIGEAAVFLASNEFITGEIIFVDGGRHLRETYLPDKY
jgi:pteridine reductase